MIIGLTGTYCAGKNFIAAILEKRGLPVLDVDKLGHQVIETEKNFILDRFGKDILSSDGSIDRKLLGAKVFGRPRELAALEAIIHPAVNRETSAWIEAQKAQAQQARAQKAQALVINAALLHRSSAFSILDALILVEAPFLVRLHRARKRDKLSYLSLIKRFHSQKEFSSQYLSKKAKLKINIEHKTKFCADIYRVKNSGFFGKKPEDQVDEILICLAIIKA